MMLKARRPIILALLLTFVVSPPFEGFDADESTLIAVRAANGVGKTMHMCKKIANRAVRNPGTHHRIVGPSRAQVRAVSGRYLWEFLKPYLDPRSKYYEGTGWNRNGLVILANGSTIELRSYEDDPQTQEGRHGLMTIGLDEVPKKSHYMANKGRAAQFIVTFTVQTKSPPDWLRQEIEGGDDSPADGRAEHSTGWVQYTIPMLRHNVPFYSDEEYQLKVSKYVGTEEEARRIWAAWDAPSEERSFSGYSSSVVMSRREIVDHLKDERGHITARSRFSLDWGNGHKLMGYLNLVQGRTFNVVAEMQGEAGWSVPDVAKAFKKLCVGWLGPWPQCLFRLEGLYGDINSSGPAGAGDSLNSLLEREILALCPEWENLPWHVQAPVKTDGYKNAREIACNHAMLEGRWFVSEECPAAIKAYKMYEGGNKDPHKDSIDGQLYGVQDLLLDGQVVSDYQVHR